MIAPAARPVLLTGGNGFVGRAVAVALGQRGIAHRLALRTPAVAPAIGVAPISAEADWSNAVRGVQAVLHLAARAHLLRDPATDPLSAYRTVNTAGTLRLAEQAAAAGVRRFVFVSTAKVHGEATAPGALLSEAEVPAPQDPYALSKWEAEQGLAAIAAHTDMEVVVVRPPLVYGPGVKANFAALMRAVSQGWPLPLAAIDNRRSLVGLDNLVDFLLLCLEHPAAANQTFLVSDGEDLSTPELLHRLSMAMGRPARLWPVPPAVLKAGAALLGRRAAAERLCGNLQVDIAKARALLNWSPPVSVDEGLRRAAAGFVP
ncbi:MAG: SDR family oxidoreductase [Pseudorhodoferax sp.]